MPAGYTKLDGKLWLFQHLGENVRPRFLVLVLSPSQGTLELLTENSDGARMPLFVVQSTKPFTLKDARRVAHFLGLRKATVPTTQAQTGERCPTWISPPEALFRHDGGPAGGELQDYLRTQEIRFQIVTDGPFGVRDANPSGEITPRRSYLGPVDEAKMLIRAIAERTRQQRVEASEKREERNKRRGKKRAKENAT